ncbi:hypothetical protein E4U23_006224 [Claviceps purpurea]|nr:hypothetical protein E4U23_006224 [Claviceps purpurea]
MNSFRDAVHIYPKNARVSEHTRDHMLYLGVSVLRLRAHTGAGTLIGLARKLPMVFTPLFLFASAPESCLRTFGPTRAS